MASCYRGSAGEFMTVLYITQNGITDHIGRSQVAPYVLGLAELGFKIHVLSAEKPGQDALIEQYQKQFDVAGIRWTRVAYHSKPKIIAQAYTQLLMKRAARRIVMDEAVKAVHCRSFPPALIGLWLKKKYAVKYIFDFRDFYADGGLEKANGLLKLIFHRLKRQERELIRHADKVVCLTNRARELLTSWYLSDIPNAEKRFQVIPCCADFKHFDVAGISLTNLTSARELAGVSSNDFVLLYLGSLGPDYLLKQMIALFKQLMIAERNARFLFVSNNGKQLVDAECLMQNVPAERIHFVSADRSLIPALITLSDLSVVFIRADISKAGCSPTKLAELFACNVPVIANTGVGDLDAIIDLNKNGSVIVKDFSDATLHSAIEQVLAKKAEQSINIRENSREFALEEGVSRYASVYRELLDN
jgi:glycosyltransferase involved in cell wall biosynthesis